MLKIPSLNFIPREEKFFAMFTDMAKHIDEAAELLKEMFERFGNFQDYASRIKAIEHSGDDLTHNIMRELNRTFITPFDREDIHDLSSALDDIIDLIDAVAARMVLFGVTKPISASSELARILSRQAKEIVKAVSQLKDNDQVLERCIEIHTLENEGDRVFHEAIARLFESETDPIRIIKEKEILETLEAATDKCEDAANVLESIIVKNA